MSGHHGGNLLRRKSPQGVLDLAVVDINHHDDCDDNNIKVTSVVDGNDDDETQTSTSKRQKMDAVVVIGQREKIIESSTPGDAALAIGAKNLFPNTLVNQSKVAEEDPATGDDDKHMDRNDDNDDDDVSIIDEPEKSPKDPPAVTVTTPNNDNVLESPTWLEYLRRIPHDRESCPDHSFVHLPETLYMDNDDHFEVFLPPWATIGAEKNVECCDFCRCIVCDKPAKECQRWFSTEHPTATTHNHCHATHTDMVTKGNHGVWNKLGKTYGKEGAQRDIAKLEKFALETVANLAAKEYLKEPSNLPLEWEDIQWASPTDLQFAPYVGKGMWKCRKCGWYTRQGKTTFEDIHNIDSDQGGPWCLICGRVASSDCFLSIKDEEETKHRYDAQSTDVYLGSKTIPFKIQVHDPRGLKTFQEQWAKHEGTSPEWTYDEAEMEEDMFRLRFGPRPSLRSILATIQVIQGDKVPYNGAFKYYVKPPQSAYEDDDDDDTFSVDYDEDESAFETSLPSNCREKIIPAICNFGYTDVIWMEKNGRVIFDELYGMDAQINESYSYYSPVAGDVEATWNKEERRGEFTVRLFIRQPETCTWDLSRLLGAWFDLFPFSLSELAGPIRAAIPMRLRTRLFSKLPMQTDELGGWEFKAIYDTAKDYMKEGFHRYNKEVDSSRAKLSLISSVGASCRLLGGVCSSDTTFSGVMRRYISEMLHDYIHAQESKDKDMLCWFALAAGVAAHHRTLRAGDDSGDYEHRPATFETFLCDEDIPLASENLPWECNVLANNTTSINSLLVHLENLGHEEAPVVEGLNVELLPFQRQTLQWALEREKNPGGLQSFLWAKLPHVADEKSPDLYYNPLLQSITTKKPKLVRGGIIAEEMGLGKTVISLALILKNPAPPAPASGGKLDSLSSESNVTCVDCVGWDPDWKRGEGQSPLKGSIVSRGTLVVCHVSLVGQWIEEAKRRLKEPGLVYAYHGQNRKRDTMTLAQGSIIVTTYTTLAKDATYHANKAAKNGVSDYCPPCEQIRWWRIICDESHALKQETVQTKAVLSLVGDHKWAVSGTPWNTSLLDVKNQLKFVGLEHVDLMFSKFQDTVVQHVTPHHRKRTESSPKFGQFVFLMRAAMIRHAQNQQYRGTSTTLMSLPPKTERTVLIEWMGEEAAEYEKLVDNALNFYVAFRSQNRIKLSSHYLMLIQKLAPLRIACSAGRTPLVEVREDDEDGSVKPKKKGVQEFSEFVFQSKVAVLMDELKQIRDKDPESKCLVFSQYTSSLKFLQEELPKHGFQFRTLSGDMSLRQRAEALNAFQHDPPTTIFLLSMRAGAVGINLTQANRVFLLEPAMNPSLEAQAIGRVYRLGQTRPVEIVRLMMKDSIETKISDLIKRKYSNAQAAAVAADDPYVTPEANAPIVGNMRTDKASMVAGEFDFLFGVTFSPDQSCVGYVGIRNGDDDNDEISMLSGDLDDDYVFQSSSDDQDTDVPDCAVSGMI